MFLSSPENSYLHLKKPNSSTTESQLQTYTNRRISTIVYILGSNRYFPTHNILARANRAEISETFQEWIFPRKTNNPTVSCKTGAPLSPARRRAHNTRTSYCQSEPELRPDPG